jgi:hypothetical protein
MTAPIAQEVPHPLTFIWRAKGANRITFLDSPQFTEAFDKDSAPESGALCIAVGTVRVDDYDDRDDEEAENEDSEGEYIVGLALAHGIAGVASGTVRATFSPVLRLQRPISLRSLDEQSQSLAEPVPAYYYARRLTSNGAESLLDALITQDDRVAPWLTATFGEEREFPADVQQSRSEARDALKLAAQFANIELPPNVFAAGLTERENETLLGTVVNSAFEYDLEEELLPLDLSRFDGKLISKRASASVAKFEDRAGRTKLVVFSVNKKPIEEELGVDLLYWDQDHDTFTFVQYKRLEQVKTGRGTDWEWAYLRRSEIAKQLDLMPKTPQIATNAKDWRATETPFWFKFVRGDAGIVQDNKALKGMNVPADWLRMAMNDDTLKSGPKGGFRLTYDNAKYINRGGFTELVKRGFVGTTSVRSKSFKKILTSLGRDRELILAVKSEWTDERDTRPDALRATQTSPADETSDLPF